MDWIALFYLEFLFGLLVLFVACLFGLDVLMDCRFGPGRLQLHGERVYDLWLSADRMLQTPNLFENVLSGLIYLSIFCNDRD